MRTPAITLTSERFNMKKSWLLLSRRICSPALILWAFTIISLSEACLKILVSLTTGKAFAQIISRSTLPGPTLGSWFTSPTKTRRVPTVTARSSACIRLISTIDISSIISTSVSSGLLSLRSKCAAAPSSIPFESSSRRWMVLASCPVVSFIRFAARPVGAASKISMPSASKKLMIALIVVVFPVPGPPVSKESPLLAAVRTACAWCSSSSRFSSF